MEKSAKRSARSGQFIVGRHTTEKISAVEGLAHSERTHQLMALSDRLGETPAQLRTRIREAFRAKK